MDITVLAYVLAALCLIVFIALLVISISWIQNILYQSGRKAGRGKPLNKGMVFIVSRAYTRQHGYGSMSSGSSCGSLLTVQRLLDLCSAFEAQTRML